MGTLVDKHQKVFDNLFKSLNFLRHPRKETVLFRKDGIKGY